MKTCFLFGHADCPEDIMPKLEQAIEDYYSNYGICYYYVGSRGRFDSLAAAAVKRAKQRHGDIKLFLLLAYHPAERPVELSYGFDGSFYPPLEGTPRRYAIVRANRYMIEFSDCLICYVNHIGNTRSLMEYAHRREQIIVNLADI